MRTRVIFAASVLALLAGCGPSKPSKVVTGAWLEGRQRFVPNRQLASNTNPKCRSELFTVDEVRREAQFYENQLSSQRRLTGRWRHLELSKLPVPQARFLTALGDNFGDLNLPERADVRSCQDAVCVVNAVYQSQDGLEGWVTYLWYLKMGNILTFKNHVYSQKERAGMYNGKAYPLKDYLYSRDELYAFWKMSHSLSTPFKTLPKLREIQRVPRTALFEGMSATTCGLAWSNGYVQLNDGCLSFWGPGLERGFIYEGTTHELAHQIDYHFGETRANRAQYYSQVGRWKEEGKWELREYFSAAENRTVREWVSGLKDEEFVRSYARTSPAEHFADTAAYFRHDGDTTKKKVPANIYAHLQSEVFEKQEYTSGGLLLQFERDVVPLFSQDLFKLALDCEQNPGSGLQTAPLAADSFPFSVSESVRRCLAAGLRTAVDQALVEAKLNHVDGCKVLDNNTHAQSFRFGIQTRLTDQIVEHVKVARANLEHYKLLSAFYKDLESRAAPLQLATGCYGDRDEASCYESALSAHIDELLPRDLATGERMREDLRRMYLDANRFEVVQAEVRKVHLDFLRSQSAVIVSEARDLWDECLARGPENRETPQAGLFSVGQGFMVSGQFNCLNRKIPESVRRSITEMAFEGFAVTDAQESKLLYDLAVPSFVLELTRLYEAATLDELNRVLDVMTAERETIRRKLSADFSWAQELGRSIEASCIRMVFAELPRDLRYHEPRGVYNQFVGRLCVDVLRSADFKNWLQEKRSSVEADVLRSFLEQYRVEANLRADQCIAKYPMSNAALRLLHKRKRDACYLDRWAEVESKAFEVAQAPYREHFSFTAGAFVTRAGGELTSIREQVMQQRFSGTTPRTPAPVVDITESREDAPAYRESDSSSRVGEQIEEGLRRTGEVVGGWLRGLGEAIQSGVDDYRRRP